MIAALRSRFQGLPQAAQYALVGLAGVLSFVLAFGYKTHSSATKVKPPLTAAPSETVATVDASQRQVAVASTVLPTPPQGVALVERLDARVIRNPFAPLNLTVAVATAAVTVPKPAPKKPPPPPAPVIAPVVVLPTVPTAPPLPFVVMGSIRGAGIANGKPVVFLNEKGTTLTVSAGDDIRGVYRVDQITATAIEFTYLPLGQRQTLPLPQ